MRVFVLCTGRCGSVTFVRAARHASNFTAGHESRCHMVGPDRLAYPPNHIEADNRLSWMLGRLADAAMPGDRYVHLLRDPEAVAQSFLSRFDRGIMRAYHTDILLRAVRLSSDVQPIDFCRDYVETVNSNIRQFLRGKDHVMQVRLEQLAEDFSNFWEWVGARGDKDKALQECHIAHNATIDPAPSRAGAPG